MRRTLLLLPLLLLVGCSGAAVPPLITAVVGSPGTATETFAAQPVSPSPARAAALVALVRSGGIIGVLDQFTVAQDGTFTLVRAKPAVRRTGQLSSQDLARLRDLLAEPGLSESPATRPMPGSDLYSYRLTFDGRRVAVQDGGIPRPLEPLIFALLGMLATYGS